MAHEIREHDKQVGRFQAWHGLTTVIPDLSLAQPDFYLKTWDASLVGIKAYDLETEKSIAIRGDNGHFEAWRSLVVLPSEKDSLPETLFVSPPFKKDTYSPLTNTAFLAIITRSLESAGIPLDVASAGSVFNRRRVFVSIPLPEMGEFKAGDREFKAFLNFITSFDQSTPFLANTSNICTVCNNTLQMNLSTGGMLVKHTKNMADRLETLPDVISEALSTQREFANDFMILAGFETGLDEIKPIFAAFVANGDKLSTRSFNITERLAEIFTRGAGNKGKNFADAFSAFTDYYTHESAGGLNQGSEMKQVQSSEFGDGARAKRDALKYLLGLVENRADKSKAIDRGNALLTAYNA